MPPPLVPRRLRLEVDERMLADGTVLTPLDWRQVARAGRAAARARASRRSRSASCTPIATRRTSAQLGAALARGRARPARLALVRGRRRRSASTSAPRPRSPTSTSGRWSSATCASWSERLRALGSGGAPLLIMLSSGGIATVETAAALPDPAARVRPGGRRARRRVLRRADRPARPALLRHGRHDRQGLPDRGRRAARSSASSRSRACTASRRAAACRCASR